MSLNNCILKDEWNSLVCKQLDWRVNLQVSTNCMKYTAGPLCEPINPRIDLHKQCSKVQVGFCRESDTFNWGELRKVQLEKSLKITFLLHMKTESSVSTDLSSLTLTGDSCLHGEAFLLTPSERSAIVKCASTRRIAFQPYPSRLPPVTSAWAWPGEGFRRWLSCTWQRRLVLLETKDLFLITGFLERMNNKNTIENWF